MSEHPTPPVPPRSTFEMRRAPRYEVTLAATVTSGQLVRDEPVINISVGGVFVDTALTPQPNSTARLVLRLPSGATIETAARVAHVSTCRGRRGLGLEFSNPSLAFESALDAYLNELAAKVRPI